MIVEFWNAQKALWSLVYWLTFGFVTPTAPVPSLASPEAVGAYVLRLPYTGDPVSGVVDFSNAPEVLAGGIEYGTAHRLAIDCDDVAVLAYACLKKLPGCTPYLYTLDDASGRFGHHVITAYVWAREGGAVERGAIDTNGWRRLPAITSDVVLPEWSRIYASRGYRYNRIAHTLYPF